MVRLKPLCEQFKVLCRAGDCPPGGHRHLPPPQPGQWPQVDSALGQSLQSCFGFLFMLVLGKQETYDGHRWFFAVVQLIGTLPAYRLELSCHRLMQHCTHSMHDGMAKANMNISPGVCFIPAKQYPYFRPWPVCPIDYIQTLNIGYGLPFRLYQVYIQSTVCLCNGCKFSSDVTH